jgi:mono/diheme cytochrome c family protein
MEEVSMLLTLFIVAVLITLAYVFYSLMVRGLRARSVAGKIPATFFGALLGTAFSAIAVVALIGVWRGESPRNRPAPDLQIAGSPEQLARGEQLAWLCVDCHSPDGELPLNGSPRNLLPASPPLGELYGPNLTPAGSIARWKDGEVVRAIREGLDERGVPLFGMPSQSFHNLSDEDVHGLVAYLRSQPALRHDQRPTNASFISYLLVGAGLVPSAEQPPITAPVIAPPRGVTPDYGRYLISISGCADCHGFALDGVPLSQFMPPGPSLRAFGPRYSAPQFDTLFRSGQAPGGRQMSEGMPWRILGNAMSDDDLRAMYAYLGGL